MLTNEVR